MAWGIDIVGPSKSFGFYSEEKGRRVLSRQMTGSDTLTEMQLRGKWIAWKTGVNEEEAVRRLWDCPSER